MSSFQRLTQFLSSTLSSEATAVYEFQWKSWYWQLQIIARVARTALCLLQKAHKTFATKYHFTSSERSSIDTFSLVRMQVAATLTTLTPGHNNIITLITTVNCELPLLDFFH